MIGRTNCISSGGSAYAVITVTTTDFIGQSVTCTNNGEYTKTSTFDSSGTATFKVSLLGTYDISVTDSGTTYSTSVTVEVIGESYTAVLSKEITLTLTVYSASADTVYYYKDNDTSTSPITLCTTDSSGTATDVSLSVLPNASITFYSTVAKSTVDGTSVYSKTIALTNSTTELKVMPDTAIYWYGYLKGSLTTESPRTGLTVKSGATQATNSLYCTAPPTGYVNSSKFSNVDLSSYSKASALTSKQTAPLSYSMASVTDRNLYITNRLYEGSYIQALGFGNFYSTSQCLYYDTRTSASYVYVYAIWFE